MVFDRNARIELTCPNWGGKWDETLGDLRAGPVRCPGCDLKIDTREFVKGIGGAERGLKLLRPAWPLGRAMLGDVGVNLLLRLHQFRLRWVLRKLAEVAGRLFCVRANFLRRCIRPLSEGVEIKRRAAGIGPLVDAPGQAAPVSGNRVVAIASTTG